MDFRVEATMMTDPDLDRALDVLKQDDGSHLGSVGKRVMAQIDSEARRRRGIAWLSLASAAAAAALIAITISARRPVDRLPLMVAGPAPPAMNFAASPPARHAVAVRNAISRKAAAYQTATLEERPAKAGPLEVRMQTDDPDVLIIWMVDGDEQEGRKGTP
jgi:hypothetical protein